MFAVLLGLSAWLKVVTAIGSAVIAWKWAVLPVRKALKRIESIGDNGTETLFDMMHRMSDQMAVQGSLQDVLDMPMFITDLTGHLVSANIACSRLLGWNVDDLRHGGWRSRLDRDTQILWDEAIDQRSLFERCLWMTTGQGRRIRVRVLLKPILNQERLLGWRGMIDRMGDGEDDQDDA